MKGWSAGLPNGLYRVSGLVSRSGYLTGSKLFLSRPGDSSFLGCAEGNGRARARESLVAEYGPEPCNAYMY